MKRVRRDTLVELFAPISAIRFSKGLTKFLLFSSPLSPKHSFILTLFSVSLSLSPPLSLCRANLSDSYFTNRQDRYVLLENCREVADFFSDLVEAVGDVSLQLQPDDSVTMLEGMVHPYKGRNQTSVCVCVCVCIQSRVCPPTCFDTV